MQKNINEQEVSIRAQINLLKPGSFVYGRLVVVPGHLVTFLASFLSLTGRTPLLFTEHSLLHVGHSLTVGST